MKKVIIIFVQELVLILILIFMAAFLFVPCLIIDSPYFFMPWIIFVAALYSAILRVYFKSF